LALINPVERAKQVRLTFRKTISCTRALQMGSIRAPSTSFSWWWMDANPALSRMARN